MRAVNKNRKKLMNRKGFSLPEVLISVGLMAFVATAAIGGIALLAQIRGVIEKQATANMIMTATVNYLRADLNDCTNPCTIDCNTNYVNSNGPDFLFMESRYVDVIIRDGGGATATITRNNPRVQYWNVNPGNKVDQNPCYGIGIRIVCDGFTGTIPTGMKAPAKTRDYTIAENAMAGTGMYSQIGGDGKITYYPDEKLFKFTVVVIDANSGETVLSQDVEVCPDSLMPGFSIVP